MLIYSFSRCLKSTNTLGGEICELKLSVIFSSLVRSSMSQCEHKYVSVIVISAVAMYLATQDLVPLLNVTRYVSRCESKPLPSFSSHSSGLKS